ncbi:MFS transporter [uncultured Marinobacter sp.]|uniref:MFS transporter n=1 Tax=uncultured Marinobacter sp. TaxID=187379 RepID=UPI00260AB163|nr:MFS transporter [uncultured Marinobacter sp.]
MSKQPVVNINANHLTLLLILAYSGTFMGRQIMSVMIEPIKTEFQASDTVIGIIAGLAFAVVYAASGLYAGRLSDRFSRTRILAICLLLWSFATIFSGLATGLVMLACGRMIVAAMESATTPASLSLISDLYPPAKRAAPISLYSGAPTISIILGLSVGAWVIDNYGWRAGFFFSAAPILVMSVILLLTAKEPERGKWEPKGNLQAEHGSLLNSLTIIVKNKQCFWLVLSTSFGSFCAFSFVTWNTPFLVRSHNLELQDAGILVGMITGATALIGTLFIGWFTGFMMRFNRAWLIRIPIIGNILNLIATVIYLFSPPQIAFEVAGIAVPTAMGWCVLAGFFSAFWLGPSLTLLTTLVSPHELSTTFAIQNISGTVAGAGLGPFIPGILSDLLTPVYGDEALRFALVISISFALVPIVILGGLHYQGAGTEHS